MRSGILVKEACVESLEEALRAEKYGANRLELCADLIHDGLTPSRELIGAVMARVNIPVKVMIRPGKGGFCYTQAEFRQMEEEIGYCKSAGVFGVVLGITTSQNDLNIPQIKQLAALAKPLNVCVHKAIDGVKDPWADFLRLLDEVPQVDAVLTSGACPTALEGAGLLKRMTQSAGDKLRVVVAGKVLAGNLEQLQQLIGATEYHGRRIVGELV